jgi:hypothetical protein
MISYPARYFSLHSTGNSMLAVDCYHFIEYENIKRDFVPNISPHEFERQILSGLRLANLLSTWTIILLLLRRTGE